MFHLNLLKIILQKVLESDTMVNGYPINVAAIVLTWYSKEYHVVHVQKAW